MDPIKNTPHVQPDAWAAQPRQPHVDPDDPRYLVFDGRRMLRVAGGDGDGGGAGGGGGGAAPNGGDPATTATAEPPAGQGGDGEGLGLYDLASVPEELRPFVEEQLRVIEGNVTRKFTEHADFRKQWEPFADIEGLTDISPEGMRELVELYRVFADPEQFKGWHQAVAKELGIEPELDEEAWAKIGEANEWLDPEEPGEPGPDGEPAGGVDPDALVQQVLDKLDERLSPIEQRLAEGEKEERIAKASEWIESEIEAVKGEFGNDDEFDDAAVKQLARAYDGADDAIRRGFQDWLRITGKAQGALVDRRLEQPDPALNGGTTDASPEEFAGGLDDPKLKAATVSRLRT